MTNSNSTDFSASDGRKFAFPVGFAFLLLAALLFWRDKEMLGQIASGLGGALFLAGILLPAYLGPIYRGWMKMALLISKVTTPIFMGVVYFLVLTPTGLIMRLVGKKPIRRDPASRSYWRPVDQRSGRDLRRQF